MPELFPSWGIFVASALVVVGAQLIYATVGFGAGMFSVALLALLLPDLRPAVATLLLLTFITEAWVLVGAWREARLKLLLALLPTTLVGMWIGTRLLSGGEVGWLKRALGAVVLLAGSWFLYGARQARRRAAATESEVAATGSRIAAVGSDDAAMGEVSDVASGRHRWRLGLGAPVGLAAGTLAGLFGTGGPPVIVLLKSYGLDKSAFRATLLWYFLLMSFMRISTYLHEGLLGTAELWAALWLLPGSLVGALAGMIVHRRLSEHDFSQTVSILLMVLGTLLLVGGGR
jgi:uncharacterized membrane protein YfcA